ncbi:MAG: ribosome silencing factor [Anaerolineales bacterium]
MLLELKEIASFTDYFIICNGTTDRMLNALADTLIRDMRKELKKKGRKEGEARDGWLIVDYGDVIVHLFSPDQREYYRLEELWSEGKVLLRLQ